LPPRVEGPGAGKAVEAVVDLHRVEVSSIVGKPLVTRELLGIEDASPVTIVEARGADAKCRAHSPPTGGDLLLWRPAESPPDRRILRQDLLDLFQELTARRATLERHSADTVNDSHTLSTVR